jgi:hypothetical protein
MSDPGNISSTIFCKRPQIKPYLHANTTQYEEMGACWKIQDEEELKQALLALQHNPDSIPYTRQNVDQFLAEIIYGGQRQRDVLKDYEQFIVKGKRL